MRGGQTAVASSWRDRILAAFVPQLARLTLAADPDGLLSEEGVHQGIRDKGFHILFFEDSLSFRFAYESRYRACWDAGGSMELVAVFPVSPEKLREMPYDLLQTGRALSFSLGELFPGLSYSVMPVLETGDLDAVYRALGNQAPGTLGDRATMDFLLRHVFEIDAERIRAPSDLLHVLLRHHFRDRRLPERLARRLIELLCARIIFEDWPLPEIVCDREFFFAFLQERWPLFLDRYHIAGVGQVEEERPAWRLRFDGPAELPFEHEDVRVYLDNMFFEGLLKPIPHHRAPALADTWAGVGLEIDPHKDRLRRLEGLLANAKATLPGQDARHRDWLVYARRWAELIALLNEQGLEIGDVMGACIDRLEAEMDARFGDWVERRYAGLSNQPPVPPVMLHHIPRTLARLVNEKIRVALVVMDGLALDQWVTLRKVLDERNPGFQFREHAVFAWVPTITFVSRQAIFAGRPPFYFPNSLRSTTRESSLWQRFWAENGIGRQKIVYVKGLGEDGLDTLEETLSNPEIQVAGLVIDKVDKIMHGMELGRSGMHNQVRLWAEQGYPARFLDLLSRLGYRIWLASDHGNVEARGCGRPAEGVIAELRGERARVYGDVLLRERIQHRFPGSTAWPGYGLPDDFLPLLAPGRTAFIREGDRIVGHGGTCLEELVVPWIEVAKETT